MNKKRNELMHNKYKILHEDEVNREFQFILDTLMKIDSALTVTQSSVLQNKKRVIDLIRIINTDEAVINLVNSSRDNS